MGMATITTETTELIETGDRRDELGRRIVPAARKAELVRAYAGSGLTQAAFARRESGKIEPPAEFIIARIQVRKKQLCGQAGIGVMYVIEFSESAQRIFDIVGKSFVEKIVLDKEHSGEKEINVDGVLVSIGRTALSELAKELGVKLNKQGEILTDYKSSETNILGVYAAGDVVEKKLKQAITGAAEGCIAASSASDYLKMNFQ